MAAFRIALDDGNFRGVGVVYPVRSRAGAQLRLQAGVRRAISRRLKGEEMATYITRRILQGIVILFLSTFLSYSIILLMPGGPMEIYRDAKRNVPGGVTDAYLEQLEKQYGLDKPYPLSYFLWLFDPEDTVDYNY
jgi:hypothetical protein